jgi:hypothetical protein
VFISYIVVVSFIGVGNRSTLRITTDLPQVTDKLSILYNPYNCKKVRIVHRLGNDFKVLFYKTILPHICSDLWQVCGYSQGTPVSYTNKTDHHNITDKHYKPKLYTLWISIEDSVLCIWKKNNQGSWIISLSEILDIFSYKL